MVFCISRVTFAYEKFIMKFYRLVLMLVLIVLASCSSRVVVRAMLDPHHPYPVSELEPFVLFLRTPINGIRSKISTTGPLPVYDRQGKKIGDLAKNLPAIFGGTSYEIIEISVGEKVFNLPDRYIYDLPMLLLGQAWFHGQTQVVLNVRPGGNSHRRRLIGLNTYGEVMFDLVVDEKWVNFQLSPRGRYLLGRTSTEGVIIDSHTGRVIWKGRDLNDGAFAPDDSTFVFLKRGGEKPTVVIQLLSTGEKQSIALPAQLASCTKRVGVHLELKSAIDQGFIFECYYPAEFHRLWFLSRNGRWTSFHKNPEAKAFEILLGLTDDRRKVVFSRLPTGNGSKRFPGFYSFDPANATHDPAKPLIDNAPPYTPSRRPTLAPQYTHERMLFIRPTANENQLVVWPLASPTPHVLSTLGRVPLEETRSWSWHITQASENGAVIAVALAFMSAKHPEVIPETGAIILDNHGKHLLSFPWGHGSLDRTGRLFVHVAESFSRSVREQVVIADVEKRSVTRHDVEELSFALIYRMPSQ